MAGRSQPWKRGLGRGAASAKVLQQEQAHFASRMEGRLVSRVPVGEKD